MATAAARRSATIGKRMPASSRSLKDSERFAVFGKHMPASSPVPFAVFDEDVDMSEFTGEPGESWSRVECVSKKAYGCGDLGKTLVESLRLYVRFGDYPVLTSSLAIRMSDKAVRRIEAELAVLSDSKRHLDNSVSAMASFNIAGSRLIAIMLVFHNQQCRRLGYHLVYDAIDSSLSLIDDLPDGLELSYEHAAVLNRIGDRGGDYELVALAEKFPSHIDKGLFCMCTPDTRANAADGVGPWKVMGRRFPKVVPWPFLANLSFAFQGKAFWADFMEGHLLYCDLLTCCSRADFISIRFPPRCLFDTEYAPMDEELMMIRTMGCVGDSICLVCIDRSETSYADDLLMMWTLDLAKKKWKKEVEISAKTLWQQDCFNRAGLPKTSLNYPVLTANGALCLVLPDEHLYSEVGPTKNRICCFDVHGWNLLWHGHVHDYEASSVILPSNFFKRLPSNFPSQS